MSLLPIILDAISARGPMRFDRFMELCLTHPQGGYYHRADPIGRDFITAPEVSQIFGEVIAAWLGHQAGIQGMEKPALAELGPGRGTLPADILRVMNPAPAHIHLVETSPTLMEKQRRTLLRAREHGALTQFEKQTQITWHKHIATLPDSPLFFIANEFFDALPARRFIKKEAVWHEIHIGHADGRLVETTRPADDTCALPDSHAASHATIAPATAAIADTIAKRIARRGGGALILDYGAASCYGDSMQALRAHAPADYLAHPGTTDLSAWVDFSRFTHAAAAHGITATPMAEMGAFLRAIGIAARAEALGRKADVQTRRALAAAVERLTSPAHMGRAFKALALLPQGTPLPVAGFGAA